LLNHILLALNNKFSVGGIFCDLSKTFDCVNHDVLLSKLEFYGITGKSNYIINFYLSDRHQRVFINNKHSVNYFLRWKKVKYGVP
jgi:hypothetical protein